MNPDKPVHPRDPGYADRWGAAWTDRPDLLEELYSPSALYRDVAMGVTLHGHEGLTRYLRHMTKLLAGSRVEFRGFFSATEGTLAAEWVWFGTVVGPLRLPDGQLLRLPEVPLSVPGVAICLLDGAGRITSHADYWDLASLVSPAGAHLVGPTDQAQSD